MSPSRFVNSLCSISDSRLVFSTAHSLNKFWRVDRTERRCPGEWPERGDTAVTSPNLQMIYHPVPCARSQKVSVPVRCSALFTAMLPTLVSGRSIRRACFPPLWQPFGENPDALPIVFCSSPCFTDTAVDTSDWLRMAGLDLRRSGSCVGV